MSQKHTPEPLPGAPTDLDLLGGPPALQQIMGRLVDQMAQDVMIGFFFSQVNLKKLKVLETAYAASHLGGPSYRGRDVVQAHRAVPIARGHFARRMQLLRETLAWARVPLEVQERWLGHQLRLMPKLVGTHSACPPSA